MNNKFLLTRWLENTPTNHFRPHRKQQHNRHCLDVVDVACREMALSGR
jgi:hypothetical protein